MDLYLKDHHPWADAVKEMAAEVGPDPDFGAELRLLSNERAAARSR